MTTKESTRADLDKIVEIATRATIQTPLFGSEQMTALIMDIENFHRHQPLDLPALSAATDMDFAHDVIGIWNHYDRQRDEITGCFVARTALENA